MPPSRTPIAAPEPAIAPSTPSALFRSAPSSNVTVVIENTDGERIAAAAPWSMRAIDEHAGRPGEPAEQRERREGREADHEDDAPAEDVADPPAEQQEAAERQRVAGDDPLEAVLGEVEILLDRRQRDVHDRDVEHHHQIRDAEHREGLPALRVGRH